MALTRAYGTTLATTSTYTRDPSTNLITNFVPDNFNNVSVQTGYDDLGRPALIQDAFGLSLQRQTAIQYSVQQRRIITQRDKNTGADGLLITAQHFDSRGRLWRARTLESGNIGDATGSNTAGILTDTQHYNSSAGRCTIVSNPYRFAAKNDPTMGWTLTDLDTMGRPKKVWGLSGSATPSCGNAGGSTTTGFTLTSYNQWATVGTSSGVMTQFTDQSSKVRQSVADGLGRVVGVVEDPNGLNYQTTYGYDVLDDLTAVTQTDVNLGPQSRSFLYNSLKRLTSSYQPEMNPMGTGPTLAASYTYTNDGLVSTRTDGNGSVTSYSYDALNRPAGTTYTTSSVTPTVTYCYDGNVTNGDWPNPCIAATPPIPLSHGRLTETRASETLSGQSVVSLTRYTVFDALGRIQGSQQTTNKGRSYIFAYTYDLAGALTVEGYPSGRQISTVYDDVERPIKVTGTLGQATTPYGSSGSYAAHGSLLSIGLGNGFTESWAYNSRLQTTQVGVGAHFNVNLTYPATANNGNVSSQTITRDGSTWIQSYTQTPYDGVNRLKSAQETGGAAPEWSQTYGYDAFGNRWVSSNASPGFPLSSFTPQAATNFDGGNHLLIQGAVYDPAGRQTQLGGYQSAYDAEGRLQSSTLGGAATSYMYDADGRRVMKETGSGTTVYVYDASGLLAAEYPTGNAPPPVLCTTCYVTPDHLGSTRLVTDASAKVIGCHDYLPFGEEIPAGIGGRSGSCWDASEITEKFTGKERDAETGLDNFVARYFSGPQGRFTSPDEPLADQEPGDPQSWNLYSYVRNKPLVETDPDGMEGEGHPVVPILGHRAAVCFSCGGTDCSKRSSRRRSKRGTT